MEHITEYFENIIHEVNDGILIIDKDYTITFANRAVSKFFGAKNKPDGMKCYSYFHQLPVPCHERQTGTVCPHKEMFDNGKLSNTNQFYTFKNGTEKAFNITTSPILDNNGDVVQTVKVIKDITDKKEMQELSKNQETFFSSILEGMQDGMVVVNRDYEILYANKSYIKQTKLPAEKIIHNHCYAVSHHYTQPCHMEGEECSVKNAFETGTSNKIIHKHLDGNNSPYYVETVAYPLKDLSGNVVSVVERVSDITKRTSLEKEVKSRVKELEDFYEMAIGRELKMIELKNEIKKLKTQLTKREQEIYK